MKNPACVKAGFFIENERTEFDLDMERRMSGLPGALRESARTYRMPLRPKEDYKKVIRKGSSVRGGLNSRAQSQEVRFRCAQDAR
jgi:hypothetical protein